MKLETVRKASEAYKLHIDRCRIGTLLLFLDPFLFLTRPSIELDQFISCLCAFSQRDRSILRTLRHYFFRFNMRDRKFDGHDLMTRLYRAWDNSTGICKKDEAIFLLLACTPRSALVTTDFLEHLFFCDEPEFRTINCQYRWDDRMSDPARFENEMRRLLFKQLAPAKLVPDYDGELIE